MNKFELSFCMNTQNKEAAIEKSVSLLKELLEKDLLFSVTLWYEEPNKEAIEKIISKL